MVVRSNAASCYRYLGRAQSSYHMLCPAWCTCHRSCSDTRQFEHLACRVWYSKAYLATPTNSSTTVDWCPSPVRTDRKITSEVNRSWSDLGQIRRRSHFFFFLNVTLFRLFPPQLDECSRTGIFGTTVCLRTMSFRSPDLLIHVDPVPTTACWAGAGAAGGNRSYIASWDRAGIGVLGGQRGATGKNRKISKTKIPPGCSVTPQIRRSQHHNLFGDESRWGSQRGCQRL